MGKRIQWIDISKGLGILLVIYGHALGGIMNSNLQLDTQVLKLPYNIIYGFHMPLFFFLSGIFASNWVKRRFKLAMKQKVFSLVIPYFIWTVITGSCMAAAQQVTNLGLGIKDILLSPIDPFSEYWFLYVLFVVFVVYYVGERLIGDRMLLLISVMFFLARPVIYRFWIFDAFSLNFLFFMFGTHMMKSSFLQTVIKYSKAKLMVTIGAFTIINVIYIKIMDESNYLITSYSKFFTIIVGITLIVYLSQLIESIPMMSRILRWLGKASMAIYVMHLIPIAGARIIALKWIHVENVISLSLVISIIALFVCVIGYYVFEKFWLGRLSLGQGLD